ncbi:MAG: hypothetical protein J6B13_00440 [Muribaculaceae bacterium]|nr:hypothetical protein [Muribaculaceae bacterium]
MDVPWYYLLIYVAVGAPLLMILDKRQIIKPKSLRYFLFIVVYTLFCLMIYDNFLAPE